MPENTPASVPTPRGDALALGTLLLALLATRLPLARHGHGLDGDAWRVVESARAFTEGGRYEASRLPGYPLQELALGLIGAPGALLSNGLTLLFALMSVGLVYAICRQVLPGQALPCAAAFAFVPAVSVNSTNTMDYLPALAFVLASHLAAIGGRSMASGFLLGVATGIRLTSVLALLPNIWLLWRGGGGWRAAGICTITGGLVGVLIRLPVFLTYGAGSFGLYDSGYPALAVTVFRLTVGVWGIIGFGALAVAVLLALWRIRKKGLGRSAAHPVLALSWVGMVAIYAALFLWKPYQPEYLLPAVPFVLLLLSTLLHGREIWVLAALLALSGYVGSITRSGVHLPGPVVLEEVRRQQNEQFRDSLPEALEQHLGPRDVLLCGEFLPMVRVTMAVPRTVESPFAYAMTAEEMDAVLAEGGRIWFLHRQDEGNRVMAGVDPHDFGAQELPVTVRPAGRFD